MVKFSDGTSSPALLPGCISVPSKRLGLEVVAGNVLRKESNSMGSCSWQLIEPPDIAKPSNYISAPLGTCSSRRHASSIKRAQAIAGVRSEVFVAVAVTKVEFHRCSIAILLKSPAELSNHIAKMVLSIFSSGPRYCCLGTSFVASFAILARRSCHLLKPNPLVQLQGRLHGSHSSQPILIRAGPGTGKLAA